MNNLLKKTLYYVTSQPAKADLFAEYFPKDFGITIEHVNLDLFEEQVENQEKIAIAKAQQAWEIVKKPLLVDDGAIFFHKYKNFPGTFTKFVYRGLGVEGIDRLLDEGDKLSEVVVIVLIYGLDTYKVFKVSQSGTYTKFKAPDGSFLGGSNTTFIPEGLKETLSEIKRTNPEIYETRCCRILAAKEVARFVADNSYIFD